MRILEVACILERFWYNSGMNRTLSDVLKQIARLTQASAKAFDNGDVDKAMRLQKDAEVAWVEARRLGRRNATPTERPTLSKLPSVRERAIGAVTELNVPSSPRLIAAYCEARSGDPFDLRAIASIRRDEYRSWKSGSTRDTYLVPALDGPWLEAARGKFVLSHWPLAQRIIGPLSPRVDHIKVCIHLTAQVESLDSASDVAARTSMLLAEYARSIPGALKDPWNPGPDFDVARVRAAARAELDLLQSEDDSWRKSEAERAARRLGSEQQLWGGVRPKIVAGIVK